MSAVVVVTVDVATIAHRHHIRHIIVPHYESDFTQFLFKVLRLNIMTFVLFCFRVNFYFFITIETPLFGIKCVFTWSSFALSKSWWAWRWLLSYAYILLIYKYIVTFYMDKIASFYTHKVIFSFKGSIVYSNSAFLPYRPKGTQIEILLQCSRPH